MSPRIGNSQKVESRLPIFAKLRAAGGQPIGQDGILSACSLFVSWKIFAYT
jgi:hypothetical protein